MAANKEEQEKSLITERDIDPEFGMFADEPEAQAVPTAEEELLETYADGSMLDEEAEGAAAESGGLPDVPDADEVASDTPVDPAAPPDQFHGTDLLNGVGNEPEDETLPRE